ncbi:hypothetical protein, partial [Nitrolancea hollandica]|uniref:hypothetical protein n=1 Tax=Nitrolancea hollandica TaxID=1206749 RepID=UPI00135F16DF
MVRSLPARLLLTFGFLGILVVGAGVMVPPAEAAYASVTVTFHNDGDLPLIGVSGAAQNDCWLGGNKPPGRIEPHSTVTFGSESCG